MGSSKSPIAIKTNWAVMAILVFASMTRLLYLLAYRLDPFSSHLLHDANRYRQWASTLASGQVWEHGAFYQAPLYPFLVAAVYRVFSPAPMVVYSIQCVFGVLTIFLVWRTARRAYDDMTGLVAAGLVALYAPLVFFETKLLPASLAVLLSALLIERMQVADSSRRDYAWLIPGAVLGLAALTNAGLLLMGLLGSIWILLDRPRPWRQRLIRITFFALGSGLLILPVTARNHRASGEWVLVSTNGGVTCYQGNNPNAVGVFSTPPGFSGKISQQREESRRLAEAETGQPMGDGAVSSFYFGKASAYLVGDPMHAAALVAKKLMLAVANEEQPLEYNQRLDFNSFRLLFPLPFAVIVALAAIRPFARPGPGSGPRSETPILLLGLTQLVVLLVFYVSGRYRLPVVPGLAAIAGWGAISLWRSLAARERRAGVMATAAVVVGAFSLAYVPLTRGELREQQLAMGYIDRAAALWEVDRRDEAIEAMRRSLDIDPVFAERHLDLARVLYQVGRFDEAEHAAREAIRRDPQSVEALFFFGVLCVEQRRLEEAASVFADILRREPTHESTANNLLGVLIHLGRTPEAVRLWTELRERGVSIDPSLDEQIRAEQTAGEP